MIDKCKPYEGQKKAESQSVCCRCNRHSTVLLPSAPAFFRQGACNDSWAEINGREHIAKPHLLPEADTVSTTKFASLRDDLVNDDIIWVQINIHRVTQRNVARNEGVKTTWNEVP